MEKLPLQLLQVVSLRHCWQVGNRPFDVQSSTKHCPFRHPSHEQHQQRNCFSTHAKRRQSHHHRRCYSTVLEALDRTIQDIRQCDLNLGGFPTLLSEDFRNILPVIQQRTRADIVHSSIKSSTISCHI